MTGRTLPSAEAWAAIVAATEVYAPHMDDATPVGAIHLVGLVLRAAHVARKTG